jgi:hypothetical protein
LVSATLLQVIGLAFGPPSLRELIHYPLLGMAGDIWEASWAEPSWPNTRPSTGQAATSARRRTPRRLAPPSVGTWLTRSR